MLGWLDLFVDVRDDAGGVDDHRDALGVACGGVSGCAAGDAEDPVGVAEQRIREAKLLPERAVVGDRVERDSAKDSVLGVELGLQITEALAFDGSTGGVGLRVEPEH